MSVCQLASDLLCAGLVSVHVSSRSQTLQGSGCCWPFFDLTLRKWQQLPEWVSEQSHFAALPSQQNHLFLHPEYLIADIVTVLKLCFGLRLAASVSNLKAVYLNGCLFLPLCWYNKSNYLYPQLMATQPIFVLLLCHKHCAQTPVPLFLPVLESLPQLEFFSLLQIVRLMLLS